MNNPAPTENRALIVELVEAREGDRMLVRIADRTGDEIYGTAFDVEPYLIEAPVMEVDAAVALAQEILRHAGSWRESFPEGRHIYYEGDEPQKFAEEIRTEFGFDPSADPLWGGPAIMLGPDGEHFADPFGRVHYFHCPPGILDAVYASRRWPMGS